MVKKRDDFEDQGIDNNDEILNTNSLDDKLDNFDIDSMMDDFDEKPKKRKPVSDFSVGVLDGFKPTSESIRHIENAVSNSFPETGKMFSGTIDVASEISRYKDQVIKDIQPSLNQFKITAKRLLPKVERILPKKLYSAIEEKLTVNEYKAPSVVDQRKELIGGELANIFDQQAQLEKEKTLNDQVEKQIDRKLNLGYQDTTTTIFSQIKNILKSNQLFFQNTFKGYMMKDLELKFKHLFVTQDIYGLAKIMVNVLDHKLEAIKYNTSLPDIQKKKLSEEYRADLREKLIGSTTKKISDLTKDIRQTFLKNIKENVFDKSKDFINDMLESATSIGQMQLDADEMAADMGEQRSAYKTIGSMIGNILQKALIKAGVVSAKGALGEKGKIFEDQLKHIRETGFMNIQDKLQNSDNMFWKFLRLGFPEIKQDRGEVTNVLAKNPEAEVPFDVLTRRSIIEIIPGYLAKILQQVTINTNITKETSGLGKKKLESLGAEELVFDRNTESFITASEFKERKERELFHSKEKNNEDIRSIVEKIYAGYKLHKESSEEEFNEALPNIVKFVNNLAKHGKVVKPKIILKYLKGEEIDDVDRAYLDSVLTDVKPEEKKKLAEVLAKSFFKDINAKEEELKVKGKAVRDVDILSKELGAARDEFIDKLQDFNIAGGKRYMGGLFEIRSKEDIEKYRQKLIDEAKKENKGKELTTSQKKYIAEKVNDFASSSGLSHKYIRDIYNDVDQEQLLKDIKINQKSIQDAINYELEMPAITIESAKEGIQREWEKRTPDWLKRLFNKEEKKKEEISKRDEQIEKFNRPLSTDEIIKKSKKIKEETGEEPEIHDDSNVSGPGVYIQGTDKELHLPLSQGKGFWKNASKSFEEALNSSIIKTTLDKIHKVNISTKDAINEENKTLSGFTNTIATQYSDLKSKVLDVGNTLIEDVKSSKIGKQTSAAYDNIKREITSPEGTITFDSAKQGAIRIGTNVSKTINENINKRIEQGKTKEGTMLNRILAKASTKANDIDRLIEDTITESLGDDIDKNSPKYKNLALSLKKKVDKAIPHIEGEEDASLAKRFAKYATSKVSKKIGKKEDETGKEYLGRVTTEVKDNVAKNIRTALSDEDIPEDASLTNLAIDKTTEMIGRKKGESLEDFKKRKKEEISKKVNETIGKKEDESIIDLGKRRKKEAQAIVSEKVINMFSDEDTPEDATATDVLKATSNKQINKAKSKIRTALSDEDTPEDASLTGLAINKTTEMIGRKKGESLEDFKKRKLKELNENERIKKSKEFILSNVTPWFKSSVDEEGNETQAKLYSLLGTIADEFRKSGIIESANTAVKKTKEFGLSSSDKLLAENVDYQKKIHATLEEINAAEKANLAFNVSSDTKALELMGAGFKIPPIQIKTFWSEFAKGTADMGKQAIKSTGNVIGKFYSGLFKTVGTAATSAVKMTDILAGTLLGKNQEGLLTKLGKGAKGALGGVGNLFDSLFGFYKDTAKGAFDNTRKLLTGIHKTINTIGITIKERPKYVDVYLKDMVEPGKPLITARQQVDGVVAFADGSMIKDSYSIDKPVLNVITKETVITENHLRNGLVDINNKPLVKKISLEAIGKKALNLGLKSIKAYGKTIKNVGKFATGVGLDVGKGVTKTAAKVVSKPVVSLGKTIGKRLGIKFEKKEKKGESLIEKIKNPLKIKDKQYVNTDVVTNGSLYTLVTKKLDIISDILEDIAYDRGIKTKPFVKRKEDRIGGKKPDSEKIYRKDKLEEMKEEEKEEKAEEKKKKLTAKEKLKNIISKNADKHLPGLKYVKDRFKRMRDRKKKESMINNVAKNATKEEGSSILGSAFNFAEDAGEYAVGSAVADTALGAIAGGGGILSTLGGIGSSILGGLGTAASLIGSAASTIGTGLATAGTAVAGVLSAPVVLAGLAAAAVGTAGYFAYKHYKKGKKVDKLRRMRMNLYNASNVKMDKIEDLENRLDSIDDEGKITEKEIIAYSKEFGFDPSNKDQVGFFSEWMNKVFTPVFMAYKIYLKKVINKDFKDEGDIDEKHMKFIMKEFPNVVKDTIKDYKYLSPTMDAYTKASGKKAEEKKKKAIKKTINTKGTEKTGIKKKSVKEDEKSKDKKVEETEGIDKTKVVASILPKRPSGLDNFKPIPLSKDLEKRTAVIPLISKFDKLDSLSAQYESGSEGNAAIGYDSTGGTSYGKYQLSSKTGTFDEFLEWADKHGADGKEVAKILRQAGNPNTGSKTGSVPEAWKKLAKTGKLDKLTYEFIKETHYDKALKEIKNPDIINLINGSKTIQNVLWSTAVQHGPKNAAKIFSDSYRKRITDKQFIKNIYSERSKYFSSSKENIKRSVLSRFNNEQAKALSMVGGVEDQSFGIKSLLDKVISDNSKTITDKTSTPGAAAILKNGKIINITKDTFNKTNIPEETKVFSPSKALVKSGASVDIVPKESITKSTILPNIVSKESPKNNIINKFESAARPIEKQKDELSKIMMKQLNLLSSIDNHLNMISGNVTHIKDNSNVENAVKSAVVHLKDHINSVFKEPEKKEPIDNGQNRKTNRDINKIYESGFEIDVGKKTVSL